MMRAFLEKPAAALQAGYHLLVLDLWRSGNFDPSGIHGAPWGMVGGTPCLTRADRPLTLAAYAVHGPGLVNAYVEPLGVGAEEPCPARTPVLSCASMRGSRSEAKAGKPLATMKHSPIQRSQGQTALTWCLLVLLTPLLALDLSGATGALDLNFEPGRGADDIVRAITVEPGGLILLGGSFRTFDTNNCAGFVRLHPNGRVDPSFMPPSDGLCNALALQTNAQILAGGHFSEIAGVPRRHLARFHPGGQIDAAFTPAFGSDDSVWSLAVQPDNRILVGGYLSGVGGLPIRGLTRLLPDGKPDPEFDAGVGTEGCVGVITLQADGRILVGGDFPDFGGFSRAGLVRLWPDGRVDEQFDAALSGSFLRVNCIVPQTDGSVLIGGRFESVHGVARHGIARLDASGSLDANFAADGGFTKLNDEVRSIVGVSPDRLWVGGNFGFFDDGEVHGVALLKADGQMDSEFSPCAGVAGGVSQIAVQPDGNLLLVGDFSYVNHMSRPGVARLISQLPSAHEPVFMEIHLPNGVTEVRFDTAPHRRYTVEVTTDLSRWGAWVSGEFTARSVSIPVPVKSFGDRQFFRTSSGLAGEAQRPP